MKNLLNAVDFFGLTVDWSQRNTIIWLIAIQAVLIVCAIALIIYLLLRRRYKQAAQEVVYTVAEQPTTQITEVERGLIGISLDLAVVKRMFTTGEDFDCEGMVVMAEYNVRPTTETILDYNLVDSDT